jgi:HD-like signal output (HDOD) protein
VRSKYNGRLKSLYEMPISFFVIHVSAFSKTPTPPPDALRLLRATADEHTGIADLVKLLRSQPKLSAEIIHRANSSAYRFVAKIQTLEHAVSLLGMETIRALALTASRQS